jgi:hypothetical protein
LRIGNTKDPKGEGEGNEGRGRRERIRSGRERDMGGKRDHPIKGTILINFIQIVINWSLFV